MRMVSPGAANPWVAGLPAMRMAPRPSSFTSRPTAVAVTCRRRREMRVDVELRGLAAVDGVPRS